MAEDNRSLLLEALAMQAGGGESNLQELLLSQLGEADPVVKQAVEGGANPQELLLSQLDETDPAVNLIARFLAQRSQTEQAESDASLDDEEEFSGSSDEKARSEERVHAFHRLRRTMEQMYKELEVLRERNDTLAAALGACYLCWGEDIDCPVCRGTGHPGSSMPDRSLLVQLVVPVVQRLQERESVDRRVSGDTGLQE